MKKNEYSNEYDYRVEKQPLYTDDGKEVDGFICTRRVDNGRVLGVHSGNYGVVQNGDLVEIAENVFNKRGLDYTRTAHILGGGKKMYMSYQFKNFNREVHGKGDIVGLRVDLQNSFDGTKLQSVVMGLLELICLNSATRLNQEFGVARRHTLGVTLDGVDEALDRVIAGFDDTITTLRDMAQRKINNAIGNTILNKLSERGVIAERNVEKIKTLWENPRFERDQERNIYSLYNAITDFTSHQLEDSQIDLRNRITSHTFDILASATRDQAKMDELLLVA